MTALYQVTYAKCSGQIATTIIYAESRIDARDQIAATGVSVRRVVEASYVAIPFEPEVDYAS